MDDTEINFKELLFIFKKNWGLLLLFFLIIFGGVAYYTFTVDPTFEASSTVVIEAKDTSFGVLEEESRNLDVYTEASIIESSAIIQPLQNTYGKFEYSVLPVKNSNLIEITVSYPDPIVVDDIANSIVGSYVDYTALTKQQNAEDILIILESRINTTQEELNQLNSQIFEVEEKRKRSFSDEFSYVQITDSISKAQNEYNYLTSRKRTLEETVVSVSATLEEKTSAQNLLVKVESEINSVSREIETLQNDLLQIELDEKLSSGEEISYLGLLQSKAVKEQQLVELLSRYERVSISKATAYASVVDVAVTPEGPSSPNILLNLMVGFILALVGAFGLVYVKEMLRGTLTSVEDIESITKLSIIGDLPRVTSKESSYLMQHRSRNSEFAEKIRMLRTQVLFTLQEKKQQIILVTSSSEQAGKTTTSVNLAVSLAHAKQKVLLIDANIRDPKLKEVFKVRSKIKGLSEVITQRVDLEDAISRSVIGKLDVLFSGAKHDYPGELLTSNEMKQLLNTAKKNYDVIILDSPSCRYSEPSILARMSEYILFIVKYDRTRRKHLETATKNFIRKVDEKKSIYVLRNYKK